MINPCAVKGISIFLQIAERLPGREFGVLPGWGTTAEDRRALERLPNVRFLPNARNIDDVLAGTRVLLMPSLWYEGFGLIVMENMLRGIPVVASDSGGLKEAKSGTGYVIPVHTIERYQPVFDEHGMPKPVVPRERCRARGWLRCTNCCTTAHAYERESTSSREVALRFVAGSDAGEMERYLDGTPSAPACRRRRERAPSNPSPRTKRAAPAASGSTSENWCR